MRTGNVIRLKGGSIVIVSNVRSDTTQWVSFNSENCSGITNNKTTIENEMCWNCDTNDSDTPDTECEFCKGTGYYEKERDGIDKATFLADNVKSYILKALTKNFEF